MFERKDEENWNSNKGKMNKKGEATCAGDDFTRIRMNEI